MSAWRRVAIEKLPECKEQIEAAEDMGELWADLRQALVAAHELKNEDFIARAYDYARWCLAESGSPDIATSAAINFYERLPDYRRVREALHRWLSQEEFDGLRFYFRYGRTEEDYAELAREFAERKERERSGRDKMPVQGQTGYALRRRYGRSRARS